MTPLRIGAAGVLAVALVMLAATAVTLAVTASTSASMRTGAPSIPAAPLADRLGATPQLLPSDGKLNLQSTRPEVPPSGQPTSPRVVSPQQKVTPHAVSNSSGCSVGAGGTMQPACAVGPHVVIPPH